MINQEIYTKIFINYGIEAANNWALKQIKENIMETQISLIEEYKEIKQQIEEFEKRKLEIENFLGEKFIYQNKDGTYTRFTKIDNFKEIQEKGFVYRAKKFSQYTCKLETGLKNRPKED